MRAKFIVGTPERRATPSCDRQEAFPKGKLAQICDAVSFGLYANALLVLSRPREILIRQFDATLQ